MTCYQRPADYTRLVQVTDIPSAAEIPRSYSHQNSISYLKYAIAQNSGTSESYSSDVFGTLPSSSKHPTCLETFKMHVVGTLVTKMPTGLGCHHFAGIRKPWGSHIPKF